MSDETLNALVAEWLRLDQNETTKEEVRMLSQSGNTDALEQCMRTRIEFGTAGLRGRMAAGWACMNDLIVIQASQGLCAYVSQKVANAASRGIVIGHDHRYNSERWAHLTASVFIDKGFKAYLHRGLAHTPLVPFSVHALGAACGVMITASHNPKDDNGYKVYWENAVQIIGPHDVGISAAIQANLTPLTWKDESLLSSDLCLDRTEEMKNGYFEALSALNHTRSLNEQLRTKFVNTSMHGVSDAFVSRAFQQFGFGPYIPVAEQQRPDPEFPTVAFPNPEEKGALNLALKTAESHGATYVLSQDPDSDRFCAAERGSDEKWCVFTGDQLGTIFASRVLEQYKAAGKPVDRLAMVASTVSSKMIEAMAEKDGFKFVECLTGFKFIGNTALNLVAEGFDVPFGYEEAIGYMFGSQVRDKDGVAATVMFAELVASLASQGATVKSYLDGLYQRYGYFQTSNSYFICKNPKTIDSIFWRLRHFTSEPSGPESAKPSYPTAIAGMAITRIVDLTTGYTFPSDFKSSLPVSSGHMIQFRAGSKATNQLVITIRTSGTEPKIKYYIEASGQDPAVVQNVLVAVVHELGTIWMEAGKNQLGCPQSS